MNYYTNTEINEIKDEEDDETRKTIRLNNNNNDNDDDDNDDDDDNQLYFPYSLCSINSKKMNFWQLAYWPRSLLRYAPIFCRAILLGAFFYQYSGLHHLPIISFWYEGPNLFFGGRSFL